jgi:hypothetical protein
MSSDVVPLSKLDHNFLALTCPALEYGFMRVIGCKFEEIIELDFPILTGIRPHTWKPASSLAILP